MIIDEKITENTFIEPNLEKSAIRSEPFSLPQPFVWSELDILDDAQLDELYTLLTENYVEDDENMFRFDYSREFLRWYKRFTAAALTRLIPGRCSRRAG